MKNLIFALFILIMTPLQSEDLGTQAENPTSIDQKIIKQQLEYEVKFTSLMLRLGTEVHDDLEEAGMASEINHADFLKHRNVDEVLSDKITQYNEFLENELSLNPQESTKLKSRFRNLNYTALKQVMKDSYVGLGPFIKRNGRGVVTGLILGTVLEFLTFGALYTTGLTSIIPYAMILPFRPIGIVMVTANEQITERSKLIKILGGIQSFRAYKKQRRATSRRLKLRSADQLILPIANPLNKGQPALESVVLSQNSWWHKILTLFNIQPSSLSFSSIKLFVEMNGMKDAYISDLIGNSELPSYLRTLLIIEHILNTKNEATVIKFMTRFSKNFVKARALPEWQALKGWTHLLLQAKDVATIRGLMASPPQGVGAKQILTIWDEVILPHYSHSYTMTYDQYRELKKELTLLRSFSEMNKNNQWDEKSFKLFDEKFVKALNHNLPVCKNPEAKALQFLLSPR